MLSVFFFCEIDWSPQKSKWERTKFDWFTVKAHQWTMLWIFLLIIWFHRDLWWSCLPSVVKFAWTSNSFGKLEALVSFNVTAYVFTCCASWWENLEDVVRSRSAQMDLAQRIVEKLQKGFCVRHQTRRHFKEAYPNRVTQINSQSQKVKIWKNQCTAVSELPNWLGARDAIAIYIVLEVLGPNGPRLLSGGPSGLLTLSFAPFGRSGRVTHA